MTSRIHVGKMALLAAVSTIALGVAALATSSIAYAEDDKPQESNLSCEIKHPNGGSTFYPPGTEISVTVDGKTEKYRCDGKTGKWVPAQLVISGLPGLVSTDGALLADQDTSVQPKRPRRDAASNVRLRMFSP